MHIETCEKKSVKTNRCHSSEIFLKCFCFSHVNVVLLQHGADPNIRNTDGKSALDLADPSAKAVLTGQFLFSTFTPPAPPKKYFCYGFFKQGVTF